MLIEKITVYFKKQWEKLQWEIIYLASKNSKPAILPLYYIILHRLNKMYILQTNTSWLFLNGDTDKHTQKNWNVGEFRQYVRDFRW